MKTPGLIEALFQRDARAEALDVCGAYTDDLDIRDCLERQYPHGVSDAGDLILRGVATLLLLAVLYAVFKTGRRIWKDRSYFAVAGMHYGEVGNWLMCEVGAALWATWKGVLFASMLVILVQIVVA